MENAMISSASAADPHTPPENGGDTVTDDANRTPFRAEPRAQLIVKLTQLALSAPDIPSAVMPALQTLVDRPAAAGSAYFQVGSEMFRARSATG